MLVTLAVSGIAASAAGAEATPRPEPTELWRNFPLEAAQNRNAVERARTGSAASAPEPPRSTTTGEARDRSSRPILQIALGILAGALVFLAVMGILVFVGQGQRESGIRRGTRRREWSFRDFVDGASPDASGRRLGAALPSAFRRTKRRAKADVHALGDAASALSERVVADLGALKAQVGARIAGSHEEPTAVANPRPPRLDDDPGAPKEKTATQPSPTANLAGDPRGDSERTPSDDELEILKAKLGKPAAPPVGDDQVDIERLKAKLARDTGVEETADTSLLKTKLAKPQAAGEPRARKATDVVPSKAKLELEDGSSERRPEAASKTDPKEAAHRLPGEQRAEEPGPAETMSAASHRFGRHRGRQSSNGTNATTRLTPLAPVERATTRSGRPRQPVAPEPPLARGRTAAARCRIVWWRGYFKSAFYAVVRTPSGDERVLAESPHFRWSKSDPPPNAPPAVEAHRSLVEALQRDGWSVAGAGEHWFTLELECRRRPARAEGEGAENEGGGT